MARKGENKPQPPKKPQQPPKQKRTSRKKEEQDDSFLSGPTDYYKILGVNRHAGPNEVRTAYKRLVVIWHPDKHLEEQDRAKAEAKIKDINQAYQVLGDPLQRRNYDAHHFRLTKEEEFNNRFGFGLGTSRRTEPEIVYTPVECSLEDLYQGTTKKKMLLRASSSSTPEETMLVDIQPGFQHGTKMSFVIPNDTRRAGYVIEEKPHPVFMRQNHDLVVNQEITILEALTGVCRTLEINTLDGRKLMVPLADGVIRAPGDEMVVPGEGMPMLKQPEIKGNLRIKFNVKFPTGSLTAEQRLDVKRGLEEVLY